MNILFGTGSLFNQAGGPFLSVKDTVTVIAEKGHKVIVIGTKDENTQEESQYSQADKENLIVKPFNKYGPYSLHYSPGVSKYLKSTEHIDVASFQNLWLWNCAKAAQYCSNVGVPYMIAPRGTMNQVAMNVSQYKKIIAKYWFAKQFIDAAHCFQALTPKEYEAIRAYGIRQPIAVIPNGISIPNGNPPSKDLLPTILHGKKIMLFLGRLHPIKNIENLLKGWAALKDNQRADWHLVIAGSGTPSYEKELTKLCAKLKITDQVLFPGFIAESEKSKWFGNADAFVLPSFSEGMPMAALEAMSYRIPCIFSSACNIPDAFVANAALECDTTCTSITITLEEMISKDEGQIKNMQKNALALVEQKFSWNIVANQLVEVYQWMIDQTKPTPKCIYLN